MLKPPKSLLPWLNCESFLTAKLKAMTGDATLKLLDQSLTPTNDWERMLLGVDEDLVLRRNILMSSHDIPCWYARTVLPHSTYTANVSLFARLKHETLGHLIFFDNQITRTSITKYSILETCAEYSWLRPMICQSNDTLWMRRSKFHINQTWPFFLMEISLPGLLKLIEA